MQRFSIGHFDLAGAATSTASLLLMVFAVVSAPGRGWGNPITVGLLLASVALMSAFLVIERRHPRPLVRLGILRSSALVHANLSAAAMFGGYAAFQFVVTLYVQDSLGWSPLGMALAFLPAGLIVIASAIRMDAVLERFDSTKLILIGLVALTAGYLLFLRVNPGMAYASFLLPTMLLLGFGFALCFPAVNTQATAGVSDDEQGLASGLVNTSFQIGGAIMLAVISAILGTGSGVGAKNHLLPGMTAAVAVVVAVSGAAVVATLIRLRPRRA